MLSYQDQFTLQCDLLDYLHTLQSQPSIDELKNLTETQIARLVPLVYNNADPDAHTEYAKAYHQQQTMLNRHSLSFLLIDLDALVIAGLEKEQLRLHNEISFLNGLYSTFFNSDPYNSAPQGTHAPVPQTGPK